MSVILNKAAVAFAYNLIKNDRITNDAGHWRQHNPNTATEDTYLERHQIGEYALWHLGEDQNEDASIGKRYKFPYGDFKTVHRDGLIATKERAAQHGYRDIEQAATALLAALEAKAAPSK